MDREVSPGPDGQLAVDATDVLDHLAEVRQEVAALALFLCSDEAAFITGTDYPIDGGFFNLHG